MINKIINETKWNDMWTLEWNEKQKKFHIDFANNRFNNNTNEFISKSDNAWSCLGVFNYYKEAEQYASLQEKKRYEL
jgi:hypothetical protein